MGFLHNCINSQTIQYMVKNKPEHTETRELAVAKRGKILSGQMDEWKNEPLYIPPLPPTNLRGCHIISVQYDIYVCTFDLVSFLRRR